VRPLDERRQKYIDRFDIVRFKPRTLLTQSFMDQLDACKDDTARRILIGGLERKGLAEKGPDEG
jgi:hypothetical protein